VLPLGRKQWCTTFENVLDKVFYVDCVTVVIESEKLQGQADSPVAKTHLGRNL
jgi:hypothetical protein